MAYRPATLMAAPPSIMGRGKTPMEIIAASVKVSDPQQKQARTKTGEVFNTHIVMKHGITPTDSAIALLLEGDEVVADEVVAQ